MMEIGLGTETTIYGKMLDKNIKVNATCEYIQEGRYVMEYYGSLVFDDSCIYDYLINELEKEKNIYNAVSNATSNYLSLFTKDRKYNYYQKTRSIIYHQYSSTMNRPISIELFHKNKTGMCLETSGLSHNYFRFLEIESDWVLYGKHNGHSHSYNVIYPHGRENEAVIYDLSNTYNRKPMIAILTDEQKNNILSNKEVVITAQSIEETYKLLLGQEIKWKNEEEKYFIFENAYPETVIGDEKPFTIVRKLIFKRANM